MKQIEIEQFKMILNNHCFINNVHFTSNEVHTVIDALKDYINKLNKPCVSSSSCCHTYVNNNISVKDYCDKNCEKCSSFY
jgi:muramoyltetrapeptide carboxypeptidase LdcA involved in peptidoglycan recycling